MSTDNTKKYYGKYRGTVVSNIDPMLMGRLILEVPDVSPTPTSWAMPCLPLTGKQMGTSFVPQIGAGVWVEFEHGNSDYPIWVGCWWGSAAEVPVLAQAGLPISPNIVLQSATQNAIVISDVPGPIGGILLKSSTGLATIIVNDTHIRIQNGACSIEITPVSVIINNGALTILP